MLMITSDDYTSVLGKRHYNNCSQSNLIFNLGSNFSYIIHNFLAAVKVTSTQLLFLKTFSPHILIIKYGIIIKND